MNTIRLAAIGSGAIVHSFLEAVCGTEGIRVDAVCSRSPERGTAMAEKFGAVKIYTSPEEVAQDIDIDAVYIAVPNILHYPYARMMLEAGKSVLLEKPFTVRREEGEELLYLAKQKGLYIAETYSTIYAPNYRFITENLPKIGDIRMVLSNFSQYSSKYDRFAAGQTPYVFDSNYGGGSLNDINYYNLALNVHLFGKPQEVRYFPNVQRGIDTSGLLTMIYPGFVSSNVGAKDTWGENFFQIEGTGGYIHAKNGAAYLSEIRVVTKEGTVTYDEQVDSRRLFDELSKMVSEMHSEDLTSAYKRMGVTLDCIETAEKARKSAGICFPGDE